MKRYEVNSSNIKSVGFENGLMEIVFKNNKTYLYHDVEADIFEEMLKAESVGKYANQKIYKKYAYSMPVKQEEGDDKDGKSNEV